ncbi:MAG: restriction endonuclease subunit S, partial [Ruminococcus sp.]|nr:restriction endonuclease subunit S [Ruminococcus sp.]
YYILNSPHYEEEFRFNISGLIGGVSKSKLMNFIFPYLLLEEQKKISAYLDEKCTKIDTIISKQQKIIEKLKDYKLSRINEIVTNVDGIECHLGRISSMKNGLNFNMTLEGNKVKFLGVGDFKDYFILNEKEMFSEIIITEEIPQEYLLENGDIVFVRSNGSKELVGRAVMVENIDFALTYSGFCIRFRNTRTDLIDDKYLLYFFRSPYFRKQLEKYSQGSNISNINQVLLSQISIIIPSPDYQITSLETLGKLSSSIDSIITKKQALIEKLTEYKKSLIYEVVTGKKEM